MFYQIIRQNHAKNLPGYADRAMPVLIITILGIVDAVQENFGTGECVETDL